MISTGHPLATEAGLRMLRSGGNAFDAIICAAAVIAVVEPSMNHVGGDVFALCLPASHADPVSINASGPAPLQLSIDTFGGEIPAHGLNAATVPGAVSAWETILKLYGTRALSEVLEPAIEYASQGMPVAYRTAQHIADASEALMQHGESARSFLPDGPRQSQAQHLSNPISQRRSAKLRKEAPKRSTKDRSRMHSSLLHLETTARSPVTISHPIRARSDSLCEVITEDSRSWNSLFLLKDFSF